MQPSPRTTATFDGACSYAQSRKWPLMANRLADRVIHETNEKFPRFWTGTLVAYPAPDCPLGEFVTYIDRTRRFRYLLATGIMRGERGVALVLEPGEYSIKGTGNDRLILPNKPPLVLSGFPKESGWFDMDAETRIPVMGTRRARYLWRLDNEAVLPIVRESGEDRWAAADVFLNQKPSALLALITMHDYRDWRASIPSISDL